MTNITEIIPFVKGQKVIDKNDPGNIAEYTGKYRRIGSHLMVELTYPNGNVKLCSLSSVAPIPDHKGKGSFLDQILNGLFGRLTDLRQLITYEKLKGSLYDIVYSMEAAQIDFYPYQYKPVIKFINSPSERLLLADEVGLGKTIEAVLIWMEMQARYQAKRLLVVCPKILAEKWRDELQQKFLIDAKIATDFETLQYEISNLRKYGAGYPFVVIGTYSGLRPPKNSRDEIKNPPDEEQKSSPKVQLLRELYSWDEDHRPFDLVIFDEAHYMRNQATTTFLLGESLSAAARAVLCVSATPVNNSNIDLHSLLRLIDEDFFATQSTFDDLLQMNRPAVAVANALSQHPIDNNTLYDALDKMSNIKHPPYFLELAKKLELLKQRKFSDPSLLAKCQDIAEKMNVLGAYVNRTRRIQVQENRPLRVPRVISLEYTQGEKNLYQAILKAVRSHCLKHKSEFHVFQIMTYQIMAASCLPAFVEKIKTGMESGSNDILVEAFGNTETEETPVPDLEQEIRSWSDLLNYDFETNDSKLAKLLSLLKTEPNEKIIIFSYYRGTLAYLQRKLKEHGEMTAMIHGGIPVDKRWDELERFRSSTGPRILLTSEVGSEGIDLQFCRVLINYDLPWNPMRVEQRIGRIDRVGQKAEKLSIINFKIKDTIEERIYDRLYVKLAIFSNSLGDLDEVLGKEIEKLVIDLISRNLTPEEIDRRINQTQQAAETKLLNIKHLEESGEGLIALSDYVQKKIEEDRGRGRYIQPSELEAYISSFFGRSYQGTVINYNTPFHGCMQLTLSDKAKDSLMNYIKDDKTTIASRLRQRTINITFDREIAQNMDNKRKIIFINHMSPFIRWITKYNKEREYNLHKTSAVSSHTSQLEKGVYIFRIDSWTLKGITNREKLAYGFISLETGKCFSSYESEIIFQDIFINGSEWIYREYNKDVIKDRYDSLEEYMYKQLDEEAKDFELENENMIKIKEQRISAIFARKIDQDKRRLATLIDNKRGESIINMTRKRIEANEERLNDRLKKLQTNANFEPESGHVALGILRVERNET